MYVWITLLKLRKYCLSTFRKRSFRVQHFVLEFVSCQIVSCFVLSCCCSCCGFRVVRFVRIYKPVLYSTTNRVDRFVLKHFCARNRVNRFVLGSCRVLFFVSCCGLLGI